ncbi:MAG: hypothetical protein K6F92_10660 [Lachnospiraceae bacterium]|nr:hypothetical protein [Lachnospiraceae bacterium]
MRVGRIVCPGCSGNITVNGRAQTAVCPYCGRTYLINWDTDDDEVVAKLIRDDEAETVEAIKVKYENLDMDEDWRTPTQEEKTNIKKAYLDEILLVIATVGVIIGYIFMMIVVCFAATAEEGNSSPVALILVFFAIGAGICLACFINEYRSIDTVCNKVAYGICTFKNVEGEGKCLTYYATVRFLGNHKEKCMVSKSVYEKITEDCEVICCHASNAINPYDVSKVFLPHKSIM